MTIATTNLVKKLTLGLAVAVIATTALQSTADAKTKVHLDLFVGGSVLGFGAGPGYGYGPAYHGGRSCRWLRRKARRTGRKYWWKRYNRCKWRNY